MGLPEGFHYRPALFSPEEAAEQLAGLLAETPWETLHLRLYGRTIPMPRKVAFYGPVPYTYSGITHPASPFTPRLAAICARVSEATGRAFNTALLNLYRDGADSMSWHRDNDYAHGGQPDLASLSLGAERRFQWQRRGGRDRDSLALASGSLLTLSGEALAQWWHAVPKTAKPTGARINVTFRHMVQ